MSLKHSILDDISKIIPSGDRDSNINSRAHIALDKLIWSMLVNNFEYD